MPCVRFRLSRRSYRTFLVVITLFSTFKVIVLTFFDVRHALRAVEELPILFEHTVEARFSSAVSFEEVIVGHGVCLTKITVNHVFDAQVHSPRYARGGRA